MDYEGIIDALREENQRVFISAAILKDRQGGVGQGVGLIKLVGGRFQIEFTTDESDKLHEMKMGMTHRRSFWMLSGLLEARFPFRCRFVSPPHKRIGFPPNQTLILDAHHIDLTIDDPIPQLKKVKAGTVEGLILNFPLPFLHKEAVAITEKSFRSKVYRHQGSMFKLKLRSFEIVLVRPEKNLHVKMLPLKGSNASAYQKLLTWRAVMGALAFITGREADPVFVQVGTNGEYRWERLSPVVHGSSIRHRPFSDHLYFEHRDVETSLKLMIEFLSRHRLRNKVLSIIRTVRQAQGQSLRATALLYAALFEGLVITI